jgi:PAS domain S-box-containing protein
MKAAKKSKAQLIEELDVLRDRIDKLEKLEAERKRAEERIEHLSTVLRAIRNINKLITRQKDRYRLLKEACGILTETRGYYNAWIVLLDGSRRLVTTAEAGLGKDFLPMAERMKNGKLADCGRKALAQSEVLVTKGPFSTCVDCPLSAMYSGRGAMTVQLEYGGKIYGLLTVSIPRDFLSDDEEQALFKQVAGDIAFALNSLELEEERKQAEHALRESEVKYRTIFETTGTAKIIINEDTTISLANREFEKLSGYSKGEVEGKKSWVDFIAQKDDLETIKEPLNLQRTDPNAAPRNYECKFIDRNGTVRDIFGTIARIPGTKKTVASFLDITEHKRGEEALQESERQLRFLSSQLLKAQENERKRIAQELHDGIGQTLSAIKFGIEYALNGLDKGTASTGGKALESIIPLIKGGIEDVRRICTDLRPSILDDLGLLVTISWFCKEFQTIYSGIRIEKQISIKESEVPDILKTVIYRILQEAFNNIAKHSQADVVRLSLEKTEGTIELLIEDNGRGFNLQDTDSAEGSKTGLGLASMKERTEYSGGSFSIESTRGAGTIARASWPYK